MDSLIIHPRTRAMLEVFLNDPAQSLCLIGPPGAGKKYLADTIAEQLLGDGSKDGKIIIEGDTSIGIEQIRELHRKLKLRTPGSAKVKRVVVIKDSGKMGDEAQNALLKTLEEPSEATVFILTSDGTDSLRPTIYSRVQKIQILPCNLEQITSQWQKTPSAVLQKAYLLSGGYIGLLSALINDNDHELTTSIEAAKTIVKSNAYKRLLLADELSKNRANLIMLLYALQRVLGAVLSQTSDKLQIKRLTSSMRLVHQSRIDLSKSANPKLLLTKLFLSL